MSQSRNVCRVVGIVGLLIGIAACEGVPGNYPGGTLASIDKYVFPSTTNLPQTVTIVDTRTGQTVWSKDVPVNKQLVIRFYADKSEDPTNPDRLDWQIMNNGDTTGQMGNSVFVPDVGSRRIDTFYRAPGELAPVAEVPSPALVSEPAPVPPTEPAPAAPEATVAPTSTPDLAAPPETAPPVDIPDNS